MRDNLGCQDEVKGVIHLAPDLDFWQVYNEEIWRQIVFDVYPPNIHLLSDRNATLFNLNSFAIFNAQARRANLRLICKDLEPLVFEALFNEIAVDDSPECLKQLYDTVTSANIAKASAFRHTASALLHLPSQSDFISLRKLHQYFPKIGLMVVWAPSSYTSGWSFDWIVGVKTLMIWDDFVGPKSLLGLSSQNPGLDTLFLRSSVLSIDEKVVFPHLTSLEFGSETRGLSNLSLPRMNRLSIDIDNAILTDSLQFFEANGAYLEHLTLRKEDGPVGNRMTGTLSRAIVDALRFCPHLKVLEVDGQFGDATEPQTDPISAHTLIINLERLQDIAPALRYWGFGPEGKALMSIATVILRIRMTTGLSDDAVRRLARLTVDSKFSGQGVDFIVHPVRYKQIMGIYVEM